jgi:predicted kinase
VLGALESLAGRLACTSLWQWISEEGQRLALPWQQRLADGQVRECHGDLHLDNVVMLNGELTAFDCIEFDPALRWIDVMSDVAFLAMDLLAHGRRDLAFGFLDDYLARSGDYDGVAVLRFYLVYRALVRAMVAALREQGGVAGAGLPSVAYLRCAQQLAVASDARLLITHGLPGSGKSHVSRQILEGAGAIRIRSDVERKRLTDAGERYGPAATAKTYGRLAELAQGVLRAGFPTIVDAAFLRRDERARMEDMAGALQVPFRLLDCQAPMSVLRERVRQRTERGGDASEADLAVLEFLATQQQALDGRERAQAIEVRADAVEGIDMLADRWLAARCPIV